MSLSPKLQLVEVDLVRRSGAAALASPSIAEMVFEHARHAGISSVAEHFVSANQQLLSLGGCAGLT